MQYVLLVGINGELAQIICWIDVGAQYVKKISSSVAFFQKTNFFGKHVFIVYSTQT